MRHLPILVLATLVFATAGRAQAPAPPPIPAPAPGTGFVEMLGSSFGVFTTATDGKKAFQMTDAVPLKIGQEYGWFIRLRTNKPTVHVREEFLLPGPAKSWGVGPPLPGMTVAPDRRSAVIEADEAPRDGLLLRVWNVAADDPSGSYVIRVTVDGQLRQFNFDVR